MTVNIEQLKENLELFGSQVVVDQSYERLEISINGDYKSNTDTIHRFIDMVRLEVFHTYPKVKSFISRNGYAYLHLIRQPHANN